MAKLTRIAQIVKRHLTDDYTATVNAAAEAAGLPANSFTTAQVQFLFAYFAGDPPVQADVSDVLAWMRQMTGNIQNLENLQSLIDSGEVNAATQEKIALQNAISLLKTAHTEIYTEGTADDPSV
ncbi:MAG: hypothetical protein AAF787_00275 [Chloroflexota bacterium]